MVPEPCTTDELLDRAAAGDQDAVTALLQLHRVRLKQMVTLRLDRRLKPRIDPSDVVQESLLIAAKRLDGYLGTRPISFYPWLRSITREQLMKHNRRHLTVVRRSVVREQQLPPLDASFTDLAAQLAGSLTGPHAHVVREENRLAVRAALEKMNKVDRTVLVLRYLEQLSMGEIAEVLGATEMAIKKRHVRALQRISLLLPDPRT